MAATASSERDGGEAPLPPIIAPHLDAIRALCRQYGVARLEVFGSAATFGHAS